MERSNSDQLENKEFEEEFVFSTSKSGGPGGQHVNKTETKVELRFDVMNSGFLSEEEKELVLNRLSNRINIDGILIITSQKHRSQHKNREDTITRFYQLISEALTPEKERKPTKPPKSSKEKRLKDKKMDSLKKDRRKKPGDAE